MKKSLVIVALMLFAGVVWAEEEIIIPNECPNETSLQRMEKVNQDNMDTTENISYLEEFIVIQRYIGRCRQETLKVERETFLKYYLK